MGDAKKFFGSNAAGLITIIVVGTFIILFIGFLWGWMNGPKTGAKIGGSKVRRRKFMAKKKRSN